MRRTIFTLAITLAFVFASNAYACDKEGKGGCAFKSGKATKVLADIEGGLTLTFELKGTAEEIAAFADKIIAKVKGCQEGTCKCKKKGKVCPFDIKGLATEFAKTEKGLIVTVKADAETLKTFKEKWEAKMAAHKDGGCGCKGECKGDCKKKEGCDCKKKEGCDCKGDCKGDCKKKGCDCKGDCKGDCKHKHDKKEGHKCSHHK